MAAWETVPLLSRLLSFHQPLTHPTSPAHSSSHLLGCINDTSVVPKLERSDGSDANSIDKRCCDFLWREKEQLFSYSGFLHNLSFSSAQTAAAAHRSMCKCSEGREGLLSSKGEYQQHPLDPPPWKGRCNSTAEKVLWLQVGRLLRASPLLSPDLQQLFSAH